MRRRVLFYVQHLLGIGHLRRAATLARNLDAAGLEVRLVSGGSTVPGLDVGGADFVQLPPVRAVDLYFKVLVDEHGREIDAAWKSSRAEALMATWRNFAPEALMFELFPFGRRQMRFELLPLLEAAKAAPRPPLVLCSVRDILVGQSKPGRNDEMLALIEQYFDRVLIHGDAGLIGFDETFPHAARLGERACYTGYVVDTTATPRGPDCPGHDEVVVSAGGGAVGEQLLAAAIAARQETNAADAVWRVLVGHAAPADALRALAAKAAAAGSGIIVERSRADFTTLLANCRLSISQGGYNTVMETLHAGARAVIAPYAGGVETEQTLRARLLSERGVLHIIDEADLTPQSLARAVNRALEGPAAQAVVDTGGGPRSAQLIQDWLAAREAS
jgi:predicted glycosyltransferase